MTLDSCKIPLEEDATGTIHVANTRVTLDTLILAFREGSTAEQIADRFPAVSLSAIYAAIAFLEVVALFMVSLTVERRIRNRHYSPEWR